MARRRLALALLLALAATSARADDASDSDTSPDPPAAFTAALERGERDPGGAAQALTELAEAAPGSPWAAEALGQAARLWDEALARPDRALELYQRLLERYPDHRLALRARARVESLGASLRSGAAPLAAYQDILRRYPTRPPAESVAAMERLVATYPDFVHAAEARLWLAREAARSGDLPRALQRYQEVAERFPGSDAARAALLGRAETLLAQGQAGAARDLFQSLTAEPDPARAAAARRGLAAARRAQRRHAAYLAALVYLAAYLGRQLLAARGRLLPLPFELKYYLPLAVLFLLASAGAPSDTATALLHLGGGGALLVWLGARAAAVRLEHKPRRLPALLASLLGAALAALALAWVALYRSHLVDFVVETLRYGPDR